MRRPLPRSPTLDLEPAPTPSIQRGRTTLRHPRVKVFSEFRFLPVGTHFFASAHPWEGVCCKVGSYTYTFRRRGRTLTRRVSRTTLRVLPLSPSDDRASL